MNPSTFHFHAQSRVPHTEVIIMRVTDFEDIQLHTHEFIEIAFVACGGGWHLLGESLEGCAPGSLYLIDCEDAHMFVSRHDAPMTIYNLIFRPGFFDQTLLGRQSFADVLHHFLLRSFQNDQFTHSLSVRFGADDFPRIARLFEDMYREYETHAPGFEELIRAWSLELLVYIFRQLPAPSDSATAVSEIQTDVFDQVFSYIQQNYAAPVSLEKLSMLAFLSPKYFSRLFKQHAGCTVTEYTQRLRVSHACTLLTDTPQPIAAIAEQVGYSDTKHFQRLFQRVTGMTPAQYRAAHPHPSV